MSRTFTRRPFCIPRSVERIVITSTDRDPYERTRFSPAPPPDGVILSTLNVSLSLSDLLAQKNEILSHDDILFTASDLITELFYQIILETLGIELSQPALEMQRDFGLSSLEMELSVPSGVQLTKAINLSELGINLTIVDIDTNLTGQTSIDLGGQIADLLLDIIQLGLEKAVMLSNLQIETSTVEPSISLNLDLLNPLEIVFSAIDINYQLYSTDLSLSELNIELGTEDLVLTRQLVAGSLNMVCDITVLEPYSQSLYELDLLLSQEELQLQKLLVISNTPNIEVSVVDISSSKDLSLFDPNSIETSLVDISGEKNLSLENNEILLSLVDPDFYFNLSVDYLGITLSAVDISALIVSGGSGSPSPYMIDDLSIDESTIHGAWSFRKLRAAYSGSCIRVRESGTSTELDIGFDGDGYVDLAAIVTHCSGNSGYIVTHYDQGLSGSHRTALTDTTAPLIYDGSTFFERGTNSKIGQAIYASSFTRYQNSTNRVNVGTNISVSIMLERPATNSVFYGVVLEYGGNADNGPLWYSDGTIGWAPGDTIDSVPFDTSNVFATSAISGIYSLGCFANSTSATMYLDSTHLGDKPRSTYSDFWGGNPWYGNISTGIEFEAIVTRSTLSAATIQAISDHRKDYWGA